MIFLYNKCIIYLSVLLTALSFFTVCCLNFSFRFLKKLVSKFFFSYGVKWVDIFSSIFSPCALKASNIISITTFSKIKFWKIWKYSGDTLTTELGIKSWYFTNQSCFFNVSDKHPSWIPIMRINPVGGK